ncbi:GNAT family N-acetyltransferase [Owenweeksia hongkongensis]|uniref:GNAT family N-acetyltransferase n=2 Tax=Owenweeksia hongkongensis TaxID=253245 RepID=UPI003A8CFF55
MPVNYYSYSHESARLIMRPLLLEDSKYWEEFMSSDEATALFPPNLKPPHFTAKDWIARQRKRYEDDQLGSLALIEKESADFVGMSGLLKQEVEGSPEIEVGYHLLPKFWKKGYAREAALYFMKFGFAVLKPESIISLIHIDNIPSQRVAQANGLTTNNKVIENHGPAYVYRISVEEWAKTRSRQ